MCKVLSTQFNLGMSGQDKEKLTEGNSQNNMNEEVNHRHEIVDVL